MANYGIITGIQITNAIVADSKEIAEEATGGLCIELPDGFGIGDTWDGTNFIKPVVEEVVND